MFFFVSPNLSVYFCADELELEMLYLFVFICNVLKMSILLFF